MVRSSRAIAWSRFRNCTTSGASASHTSNGTVSSQASISSASSRACQGPCAAMTPTSVKWPRAVQQLRSLRDQHLARLVPHQGRLVLQRAHANKSHRRPGHRFTYRGCVRRVVLLPADIWLHINRRHHPRVMAERDQLARPMMRRPAGFKPTRHGASEAKTSISLLRLIALATTTRPDASTP
jgi:hypothetical protein